MLGYSQHVFSLDNSAHARTYRLLKEKFSRAAGADAAKTLRPIAAAIARILASGSPPRRIVAPLTAKLHYLAHAALPERLQDALLFDKMKKGMGIDL
jgi:hypothetical protein